MKKKLLIGTALLFFLTRNKKKQVDRRPSSGVIYLDSLDEAPGDLTVTNGPVNTQGANNNPWANL